MKIITITLNPAFDVHCSAEHYEACHENLATITEREAGGKGVNISRALTMNGVDNLALLAVGDANGADFCRELDKKKAQNVALLIDGNDKLVENTLAVLKETGTNVIENVKTVKFGGLPFLGGKLTDDEKADLLGWAHSVVDSIK